MVIVSATEPPQAPRFVTALITTGNEPACVGVPDSWPINGDKVKPGGSTPPGAALQLQGATIGGPTPPVQVNCTGPYGTPTVPSGTLVGVTVIRSQNEV